MASGADLKVNIEQAVHSLLRDFVQGIEREHGLLITRFSCDWIDVTTPAEARAILGLISVTMDSRR